MVLALYVLFADNINVITVILNIRILVMKVGTLKSQDGITSGPESDKNDESIVSQDKEVPLNMSVHLDAFSKVDGAGSADQSKFNDTPVLSDQQKE